MGFGNGYNVKHDRGSKRYDNSMVAHVWNAQSSAAGQSGNGNFYFEGRTLYSYGTHYVVGFIDHAGVAWLNDDKSSVTTSGHQSEARSAVRDRETFRVEGLTELRDLLVHLAYVADNAGGVEVSSEVRKRWQVRGRALLATHYVALQSKRYAAGESRRSEAQGEEAGAYLARALGLPAQSWGKIKREATAAAAKAKADKESALAKRGVERALWLADMTPAKWNAWQNAMAAEYGNHNLVSTRKELKAARSLMLKATRGKLASATRLAAIRERIKRLDAAIDGFNERRDSAIVRQTMKRNIGYVKAWRDASPKYRAQATTWSTMRDVGDAAEYLAKWGRLSALRTSAAALVSAAQLGRELIETENNRLREVERARQERERQARDAQRVLDIAAWYRGERVRVRDFDAASGGAALRVIGDELETSRGARVPLDHAVKAFRFIKLVRERGEGWQANGRTIHVGHFKVDRILPTGDFTAGCHSFTWPEIERVAIAAGVFDCPASDTALVANA